NHRIRRIGRDGTIVTIAGTGAKGRSGDGGPATAADLIHPGWVGVGPDGDLFIGDERNRRIRKVNRSGVITTFPRLTPSSTVTIDREGSIVYSDMSRHRVFRVAADGRRSLVAGTGGIGCSGDGGAATEAAIGSPRGLAMDASGDLFIADAWNNSVRR